MEELNDNICPFKSKEKCHLFCPVYSNGNIKVVIKMDIIAFYNGSNGIWILNQDESKADILIVTDSTAKEIIAPELVGKIFKVVNSSGGTVTIKKLGGAGVEIPGTTSTETHVKYVTDDYESINFSEDIRICNNECIF